MSFITSFGMTTVVMLLLGLFVNQFLLYSRNDKLNKIGDYVLLLMFIILFLYVVLFIVEMTMG